MLPLTTMYIYTIWSTHESSTHTAQASGETAIGIFVSIMFWKLKSFDRYLPPCPITYLHIVKIVLNLFGINDT
jgi:hypothetical protein